MRRITAVVLVIIMAVIAGALAIFTDGYSNWDAKTWFEKDPEGVLVEEETDETTTSALRYVDNELEDPKEELEVEKTYVAQLSLKGLEQRYNAWTVSVSSSNFNDFLIYETSGLNPSLIISHSYIGDTAWYAGSLFYYNGSEYMSNYNVQLDYHYYNDKMTNLYNLLLIAKAGASLEGKDYIFADAKNSIYFQETFLENFLGFYDSKETSFTLSGVTISAEGEFFSASYDVTFHKVYELPEAPKKDGYIFDGYYLDEACTIKYTENYISGKTPVYARYVEGELSFWEDVKNVWTDFRAEIIISIVAILVVILLITIILNVRFR